MIRTENAELSRRYLCRDLLIVSNILFFYFKFPASADCWYSTTVGKQKWKRAEVEKHPFFFSNLFMILVRLQMPGWLNLLNSHFCFDTIKKCAFYSNRFYQCGRKYAHRPAFVQPFAIFIIVRIFLLCSIGLGKHKATHFL